MANILWKAVIFSNTENCVRRMTLYFIISTNLFNIWFNRKQMDSHLCLCVQSVAVCFSWNTSTLNQLCGWKKEEYFNYLYIYVWIFSDNCVYSYLILH